MGIGGGEKGEMVVRQVVRDVRFSSRLIRLGSCCWTL